jgi:dolichyl-phosphate-mannose-protein mannosyltransferase
MHHSPTDKSQGAPTAPAPAREPCEVAPPSSPVWAAAARVLPALLFIFALATRLWGIGKPAGIVFDELHFGKFVQWTLKRWYYFDIHPPLAKQTLAVLSILWGYDPDKCDYEPPAGQPRTYAPDCEYWKLRCIVAAFSAAACVLMFFVARRLGATVAGACLAALLEVFSVMHNVEGRLILLNSQLIFWLNASLLAGLAWFARANRAPRMALGERLRWAAGVGALCGNAVCIKHTGLATPGLLGVEAALGLFFLRQPLPLLDLLTFVASMAATYTLWFAIHIGTMIHSHATLRQEQEFMSPQYQSLLLGSPTYDPNAKWTEGFWWTFVTLNRRMVVHSAAITQPHAWGTRPWEWIFALRGVSYWCGAP